MILVDIDMPECCAWCPFREKKFCLTAAGKPINLSVKDMEKKKPDWCPIKGTADFFSETLNFKKEEEE